MLRRKMQLISAPSTPEYQIFGQIDDSARQKHKDLSAIGKEVQRDKRANEEP
jgi:hypothetical protein